MQSGNDNKGSGTGKVKSRQVSNLGKLWKGWGFPVLVILGAILLTIQFSGSEAVEHQSELTTQPRPEPVLQQEQSITILNPDQGAEFDPAGISVMS